MKAGYSRSWGGLYSNGKANLDVFNKAHAGSPVRVDRGGRTVHLQRPALSFGLAIQPAVLRDFGSGGKRLFRGIGTLARFLYCIPNSNIGQRNIKQRSPVPEALKRIYGDKIFKLLEIKPLLGESGIETPRTISLSPQALADWEQFSQYIESEQGEGGKYEHIQDWTAKLPGAALRIAGLCNVAEHGESVLEIGQGTMRKALDLCELLIPHTLTAIDMMEADPAIADAKAVIRWIRKNGELTFTQTECLIANKGRFTRAERLLKAFEVLREWNVISAVDPVKMEHSKKPIHFYHVNPKIFKETEDGMA